MTKLKTMPHSVGAYLKGVGVESVELNANNHLIVHLDNGEAVDAGEFKVDDELDAESTRPLANKTLSSLFSAVDERINTLVGGNATEAIDNLNEIIAFLQNFKDSETLASTLAEINEELQKKVDKVEGKGLSTNDYADEEKAQVERVRNGSVVVDNTLSEVDGTSNKPVSGKGIAEAIEAASNNLKERGYIYKGVATPITNPVVPDGPVFYIATQAGVYENFNGIALAQGESAVIEWNSGSWNKKTISSAEALGVFGDARLNALVKNFYFKSSIPNYTKVGRVRLIVALSASGKYYNAIYLYDKDTGVGMNNFEKAFQTEEEAIADWNTGHCETSAAVIDTVPVEKPIELNIITNVNHPLTAQYAFTPISLYNEQVPNCVAQIDSLMAYRATAEQRKLTVEKSVNMFNVDTAKDGYFIGGTVHDSTKYKYSTPIFVRGGVRYKQTKPSGMGGNRDYQVVSPDGKYLSYGNPEAIGDFWYYIFSEDCYISINAGDRYSKVVFAEESLFPDSYIGYEEVLPQAKIHAENIIGEKVTSVLEGKILSVNGDSICAGAGYSGGYAKIIGEKYNMTVQNIGVGGATIAAETKSGDANRHWICRTISSMREDADYAIVEGGVNDRGNNVQMGELSSGYDAELDDTTFYGAFESMLKHLIIRFAGKKIGYIAVHKMTSSFSSTLKDGEENCYHAAKRCCEKWGVPFLDLNTTVPPFEYFTGIAELDSVTSAYTHDGDGWHPNEEGYKKYYCDKIVAWMETL